LNFCLSLPAQSGETFYCPELKTPPTLWARAPRAPLSSPELRLRYSGLAPRWNFRVLYIHSACTSQETREVSARAQSANAVQGHSRFLLRGPRGTQAGGRYSDLTVRKSEVHSARTKALNGHLAEADAHLSWRAPGPRAGALLARTSSTRAPL
jgi:hypothetical protein